MKTKIITSLILGILLLSFQLSQSQVLYNGDFESSDVIYPYCCELPPMNNWNSFKNIGIDANATVVGGVCNYQITNAGIDAWEVQLEQLGFNLIQGHSYRFQFDVKADEARWYGLFLGEYYGSWTTYLGWENYWQYATTEWQTMSFDFKAACTFDINKVSFEIGGFNISMYFDNISIIDLGPYTPEIGIIGTALTGWDTDFDMQTTDGIHYTLLNQPLVSGWARFRQDNLWCYNWGSNTYPTGIAPLYGPNIPVLSYGNYDITFNRETGEYSFTCASNCPDAIGIIGTAVPPFNDWLTDVNMSTNDGENYFLKGYVFATGEAKFRKDDSFTVNWSNTTFPTGIGYQDGNSIPVTAGIYNVAFNNLTGEYSFAVPEIGVLGDALIGWDEDIDMQTTDGITYTLLHYPFKQGEVKFRLDNNWEINWGNTSFPQGFGYQDGPNIPIPCACTYDVTFNAITGEYNFVLNDTEPPVIEGIGDHLASLWPPNHIMVPVQLNYSVTDNCCGEITTVLQISSNEPVNGLGDGDTAPDWEIIDEHNVLLRAERSGKGAGRIYSINILSTDASGNTATHLVTVDVPHDNKHLKFVDNTFGKNNLLITTKTNGRGMPEAYVKNNSLTVLTWPNPATQIFNLRVESSSNETIEVFISDVIGRRISKLKMESNRSVNFGDNLMPGIYILEIRQGVYSKIIKVVKE